MKPVTRIATSASPRAVEWLQATTRAYPLHIFDQVINLVNQEARVLSIVAPDIGNGPFSLMVEMGGFRDLVSVESQIFMDEKTITVGNLLIDYAQIEIWDPRLGWESLTRSQIQTLIRGIRTALGAMQVAHNFPGIYVSGGKMAQTGSAYSLAAGQAVDQIRVGLQLADQQAVLEGAAALAGLGVGLTPAGDDFLVGMLHGLWARAAEKGAPLGLKIAQAASHRTSTLSAAWLEAASQGEAAQVWHDLLEAVQIGRADRIKTVLQHILQTGETSGADALSGFYFILNQEQIL